MTDAAPRTGLRILVVDDEPAMVGAITALVGSAGHQVVTAYDGDAALRRFEEDEPDLVLLDLAMPGRDGVEVCREIRRTSLTPIIVLTGESDELAKVEALDAGADDYVTKPFGRQELLARIRAVMRRHETSEAAGPGVRVGPLVLAPGRHVATVDGTPLALTRTEFALAGHPCRRARPGGDPRSPAGGGLAPRARAGPAVAEAPPRPTAGQARGGGRPAAGVGAGRRLPAGRGGIAARRRRPGVGPTDRAATRTPMGDPGTGRPRAAGRGGVWIRARIRTDPAAPQWPQ